MFLFQKIIIFKTPACLWFEVMITVASPFASFLSNIRAELHPKLQIDNKSSSQLEIKLAVLSYQNEYRLEHEIQYH